MPNNGAFISPIVLVFVLVAGCSASPEDKLNEVLKVTGTVMEGATRVGLASGTCVMVFSNTADVKVTYEVLGQSVAESGSLKNLRLVNDGPAGTMSMRGTWDNWDAIAGDGEFVLRSFEDRKPVCVLVQIENPLGNWIHYVNLSLDQERYSRLMGLLRGTGERDRTNEDAKAAHEKMQQDMEQAVKSATDPGDTIAPTTLMADESQEYAEGDDTKSADQELMTQRDSIGIETGRSDKPHVARVYSVDEVQQTPEFPGGMEKFQEFVAKTMRYPSEEEASQIQGKVYVQMTFNPEGYADTAIILRSVTTAMDKEALRIVNLMPKWNPATLNDEPVPCRINVPIEFSL